MTRTALFYLKFILFSCLFFLSFKAEAVRFSGKITDIKGEGIPYATVYIHELKLGISADLNGEFSAQLKPGHYTIEVSSLGYKREKFYMEKGDESVFRTFVLDEVSYELNEAMLSGRDDDRGTSIMKRAIAMAPRFRYQVKEYMSENYLKGTVKINKIPAIFKFKSVKEMADFVTGKLFVLESHSTIKFTFPDKYEQTVKAFSSSIPDEMNPGDFSMIMKSSIYEPELSGMISPLSSKAFSYYRFVFQGITTESGRVVNKILVVPKRGNSKLFAGHLYIVDNIWNVAFAELVTDQSGININVKINYNEVAEGVFLPTTYNIKADINYLGIKGEGRYFSSSSYKEIKTNTSALGYKSEIISSHEKDMKRSEARSIAKKLEQELAPEKKEKASLELKSAVSNTTVKVDSTAKQRDSTYWLEVRKVPLRGEEVVSYKKRDSLKIEFKAIEKRDSVRSQNSGRGGTILEKIFFGHKLKLGQNLYFTYGGLSKAVGDFNFVDGYQFGQNIFFQYTGFKNAPLKIGGAAYYSVQREEFLWNSKIEFSHTPLRGGSIVIEGGRETADISNNPGVSRFINSYASFFFGVNPVKLMDKNFLSLSSALDIANGLKAGLNFSANKYSPLQNSETTSLFGKKGSSNMPENIFNAGVSNASSLVFSTHISYTPRYFYRIDNGYKRYVRSVYPTFNLRYSAAIKTKGFSSSWSNIELEIKQKIKTDIYSSLTYSISGGLFLSAHSITLPDYKHFAASDIIVSDKQFSDRYQMVSGYLYSTSGSWMDIKINYVSEYILLKRLPFMDTPLLTEALHFKSLWLPGARRNHNELGYSIGVDGIGRFGAFIFLNGIKYNGINFRLSLPLFSQIH